MDFNSKVSLGYTTRSYSVDWGPYVNDPDSPPFAELPATSSVVAANGPDVDSILKKCADSEESKLSQGSLGDIDIDMNVKRLLKEEERESNGHNSDKAETSCKGSQETSRAAGDTESLVSYEDSSDQAVVALTLAEELRELELTPHTLKTKPKLKESKPKLILPALPKVDKTQAGEVARCSDQPSPVDSAASAPKAVHPPHLRSTLAQLQGTNTDQSNSKTAIVTLERINSKQNRPSNDSIKQQPKAATDQASLRQKIGRTTTSALLTHNTALSQTKSVSDQESGEVKSATLPRRKTSRRLPDVKAIAEAAAISNLANKMKSPSRPKSAPPLQMRRRRISFRKKTPPPSPTISDHTPSYISSPSEEEAMAYNSDDNVVDLRKKIALLEWKQSELVQLFRRERTSLWKVVHKQSEAINRMITARNRDIKRAKLHRRIVHRKLGRVEGGVVQLGRECAGFRHRLGITEKMSDTAILGANKELPAGRPKLVKQEALIAQRKTIKLQKFFGDSPPLLELFLKRLGYEQYTPLFVEHQVGLGELPHIREEQLVAMGIPLGPRQRIINESRLLGM